MGNPKSQTAGMLNRWNLSGWSTINTRQLQTGSDCFIGRGQEAGNMSDFKTNKVSQTTAIHREAMKIAGRCPVPPGRIRQAGRHSICVIFKEQNVTEQWTCSRHMCNRVRNKVTLKQYHFLNIVTVVNVAQINCFERPTFRIRILEFYSSLSST